MPYLSPGGQPTEEAEVISDTARQLVLVHGERIRQDAKWGLQAHPDGTGEWHVQSADHFRMICDAQAARGEVTWTDILLEEVYEALSETDPEKLAEELRQVAAVAVNWLEAIHRRKH
jgi:hypothetical protein